MLIEYIKTAVVLKHQQFEDNKSEKTGPRISKHECVGVYDDESLDKYKGEEGKDVGYNLLLFVTLPPLQKESNRLTDMDKGTRNLNHLVCT